jgi:hypothetical protein
VPKTSLLPNGGGWWWKKRINHTKYPHHILWAHWWAGQKTSTVLSPQFINRGAPFTLSLVSFSNSRTHCVSFTQKPLLFYFSLHLIQEFSSPWGRICEWNGYWVRAHRPAFFFPKKGTQAVFSFLGNYVRGIYCVDIANNLFYQVVCAARRALLSPAGRIH